MSPLATPQVLPVYPLAMLAREDGRRPHQQTQFTWSWLVIEPNPWCTNRDPRALSRTLAIIWMGVTAAEGVGRAGEKEEEEQKQEQDVAQEDGSRAGRYWEALHLVYLEAVVMVVVMVVVVRLGKAAGPWQEKHNADAQESEGGRRARSGGGA